MTVMHAPEDYLFSDLLLYTLLRAALPLVQRVGEGGGGVQGDCQLARTDLIVTLLWILNEGTCNTKENMLSTEEMPVRRCKKRIDDKTKLWAPCP